MKRRGVGLLEQQAASRDIAIQKQDFTAATTYRLRSDEPQWFDDAHGRTTSFTF